MPAWGELLDELKDHKGTDGQFIEALSVDSLRLKYLNKLSNYTGRNAIAYYSGWLSNRSMNVDINDSDMTGLMSAMKGLDYSKGLDLILHTPGGNPTAAEGMVNYLHSKFDSDIRVFVPQMAMSAGTMLACASKQIIMGKHSCLGPIDPQFGGIAAYNIVSEFTQAKEELSKNPNDRLFWELQLKKYPVAFLYSVIDAINLSSALTEQWLEEYLLAGNPDKSNIAKKIVGQLNTNNKSHSRHFSLDFCRTLGMSVSGLEENQDLQELVLSVHHAFVITFDATKASKIIENQNGIMYVTRQQD